MGKDYYMNTLLKLRDDPKTHYDAVIKIVVNEIVLRFDSHAQTYMSAAHTNFSPGGEGTNKLKQKGH